MFLSSCRQEIPATVNESKNRYQFVVHESDRLGFVVVVLDTYTGALHARPQDGQWYDMGKFSDIKK